MNGFPNISSKWTSSKGALLLDSLISESYSIALT